MTSYVCQKNPIERMIEAQNLQFGYVKFLNKAGDVLW
jgi:hypothetical protein